MSTAIEEYKKSVREEGRQEGREEGRQEGAKEKSNEIVTNMLHENMGIPVIEKVTRLPQEQIIQIAKANNIPLP